MFHSSLRVKFTRRDTNYFLEVPLAFHFCLHRFFVCCRAAPLQEARQSTKVRHLCLSIAFHSKWPQGRSLPNLSSDASTLNATMPTRLLRVGIGLSIEVVLLCLRVRPCATAFRG